MKKLIYVFGPIILIMFMFAVVIGTGSALLEYYKVLSRKDSYIVEIILSVPIVFFLVLGPYDPDKRLQSYIEAFNRGKKAGK